LGNDAFFLLFLAGVTLISLCLSFFISFCRHGHGKSLLSLKPRQMSVKRETAPEAATGGKLSNDDFRKMFMSKEPKTE